MNLNLHRYVSGLVSHSLSQRDTELKSVLLLKQTEVGRSTPVGVQTSSERAMSLQNSLVLIPPLL